MGQTKKRNYDRYTLEFKQQAVKLANHPKVIAKDIAESLEENNKLDTQIINNKLDTQIINWTPNNCPEKTNPKQSGLPFKMNGLLQ